MPDPEKTIHPSKKSALASSVSASGGSAGAGTGASSSSSSHSGSKHNATNTKEAGEKEELTLRVLPFDEDSSSTALTSAAPAHSSILPSLVRPLLRVKAKSVSVAKVQRFIHKRMSLNAPPDFPPEAIEILRNGVVQPPDSSISQMPQDRNRSTDDKPHHIVLHYRWLSI